MRNIVVLFVIAFLNESVTACVAYLFALTRLYGGDVNTVLLLQLEFIILLAIIQIPTGRFADHFGYKKSILLGMFITLSGAVLYVTGQSIASFFVAEALWALGLGFVMGADVSLLKASLVAIGKADQFQSIRGSLSALKTSSRIGFFFLGGVLVEQSLYAPFYLEIAFLSLSCMLALLLRDVKKPPAEVVVATRSSRQIVREYMNPYSVPGRIIIAQALIMSGTYMGFWLCTPWLEGQAVSEALIGACLGSLAGIVALSNILASRWKLRSSNMLPYMFLVALVVIGFLLLSTPVLALGLVGLAAQKIAYGFTEAIVDKQLLEKADEFEKATILSIAGMSRNGLMALLLIVAIAVKDWFAIPAQFMLLGALITAMSMAALLVCCLRLKVLNTGRAKA